MKCVEEGPSQFVIARCDGAVDFEMSDHSLDDVALFVDAFVPADRVLAVGTGRNDRTNAIVDQCFANSVAVVSLVREQMFRPIFCHCSQRIERRGIVRFSAREVEGERDAAGVTETMNFTAEPAPRAAKSLFASPPFAPAAETWPRTVVESML